MSLRTLLWILLAQACGGSAPALTKLALEGLGPSSLVVVRQILGGALLALAIWARSRRGGAGRGAARTAFSGRDWMLLLLLSWGGFALPQILNAWGLRLSSATNGALLIPLEPIGILIGGALFLREPFTAARAVAVLLGIGGGTLIVLQGGFDTAKGNVAGDLLMAFGHLSWAIYTLAAKPLLQRHDALLVTVLGTALSPLPLLPFALAEPFEPSRALAALGWIALLALVVTAFGTFAWNRALRSVETGTIAVFVFVQPLWGLLIGVLALGEPVGGPALAGAALIVCGVTLAVLRGAR